MEKKNILSEDIIPALKEVAGGGNSPVVEGEVTFSSGDTISKITISASITTNEPGKEFDFYINPSGQTNFSTINASTNMEIAGQLFPVYVSNPYISSGIERPSEISLLSRQIYTVKIVEHVNLSTNVAVIINRQNMLSSTVVNFMPNIREDTVFHADYNDDDYTQITTYRLPDGTQIVTGSSYFYHLNINNAWGSLYATDLKREIPITMTTYPFIDTPRVTVSPRSVSGYGACWISCTNKANTFSKEEIAASAYQLVKPAQVVDAGVCIDYIAVGRWK